MINPQNLPEIVASDEPLKLDEVAFELGKAYRLTYKLGTRDVPVLSWWAIRNISNHLAEEGLIIFDGPTKWQSAEDGFWRVEYTVGLNPRDRRVVMAAGVGAVVIIGLAVAGIIALVVGGPVVMEKAEELFTGAAGEVVETVAKSTAVIAIAAVVLVGLLVLR